MNTQWKEFLLSQNAQLDELGAVKQFEFPELERTLIKHGPVLTSLAHKALLKVSGEDALEFLQNQLTNELSEVSETQAQRSAYCDPQGNVLAIFLIFMYQGSFYLSFDASLKEAITKRLTMFILRSKVTLEDASEELIHLGYAGQFAHLDIQRRLNVGLRKEYTSETTEETLAGVKIIKVPGPFHTFEIFAPLALSQEVWNELKRNGDLTNSYDWNLLNIAMGIPEVTSATSGKHLAQFLNLEKLEVINFKKGCFPGQEVIARMHYRGKAAKRMLRIHLDETLELQAGDELELKDSNDKIHKLDVILANPEIFSGTLCLAVGNIRALDQAEDETLTTLSGNKATLEPLPYSVTDEE